MCALLKIPKFKYTIEQPASNPLLTLKIPTLSVYSSKLFAKNPSHWAYSSNLPNLFLIVTIVPYSDYCPYSYYYYSKLAFVSYKLRYSLAEMPVWCLKYLPNMSCYVKPNSSLICCMLKSVDFNNAFASRIKYLLIHSLAFTPVSDFTVVVKYLGVTHSVLA